MDIAHCIKCEALIWNAKGDQRILCDCCFPPSEITPHQTVNDAVRNMAWGKKP